jgi:hypothetical protein
MQAGSGDDVADLLRRAVLGVEGGGPFGQLAELGAQLLQFPDAPIEVGGVALQQVADKGAEGLTVT